MNALNAAILDWVGTAVDCGCQAPVAALDQLLREQGLEVSQEDLRRVVGVHAREQLRQLFALPTLRSPWQRIHGEMPGEEDLQTLHGRLVELRLVELQARAQPIAGAEEAVARLRERGLQIGSTSACTRRVLQAVADVASSAGYRPKIQVASDEVSQGRPAPFLCFEAAMRLGVYPLATCVKVGDAPADVLAGRNAGMWTVGLTLTGAAVGLDQGALEALSAAERDVQHLRRTADLEAAGAHYTIPTVADLPSAIEEIEDRMQHGELP